MTANHAKRITGYEVVVTQVRNIFWCEARDAVNNPFARAWATSEKLAIQKLVSEVLTLHGMAVFRRQRYRCAECGQLKPLQRDHIKPRSKGRDDRISNLQGLCHDCHEIKHGRKL